MSRKYLFSISFILILCYAFTRTDDVYSGWTTYAGGKDGIRYSSNSEINRQNVGNLKVAWVYTAGDSSGKTQIQINPIVVNGVLYGINPQMGLFAIDAVTGKEIWTFEPSFPESRGNPRGVTYWENPEGGQSRILYSAGPYMYAVDARSGISVKQFGEGGFIDLRKDLDGDFEKFFVSANAPGIIFNDLIITSMRVSEKEDAAPGHIRAFDVITGKRKWIFHTIPVPGQVGYDSWEDKESFSITGGANNWAGMALDEKLGIVYIPTGSATPDFYGKSRPGANLFANSIIALDAATGKYIWHYQVVHHDLWDRDLPANPNLVRIQKDGRWIDALAQITKHGYIFLLDRTNGKPVFPINEVPVPASDIPGEQSWPTQPIPTLPEPFARQQFGPGDISDRSPQIHANLLSRFNKLRSGNLFMPPSFQGTFIFPGFDGGGQWGGASFDPESQIMYVNASEVPWWTSIIKNPALETAGNPARTSINGAGRQAYLKNCVACHGPELEGKGEAFPALVNIGAKLSRTELKDIINHGRNMMPAFNQIPEGEKEAILSFLLKLEDREYTPPATSTQPGQPARPLPEYIMSGFNRFYDEQGYPGIKPPWGTLNAVNLSTGNLLWKVPLGEFEELTRQGIAPTGTENYGGSVVTKGGLVFIAATQDEKIRAFDKKDGKILWEAKLPAAGFATPAVYAVNGKQFVVIACGGGKLGKKSGNKYVAFALP